MTWQEWMESEYNEYGYSYIAGEVKNGSNCVNRNNRPVKAVDTINPNFEYTLGHCTMGELA